MYIGLCPSEFWDITPWQLSVAIKSNKRKSKDKHSFYSWHTWHTATLHRMDGKKFPKLKEFVSQDKKERVQSVDGVAIMEQLKAYSRYYKEAQDANSKTSS